MMIIFLHSHFLCKRRANGSRYPLVGGTRLAVETEKTESCEKAQKRGAYQLSTAPWNDGERSFSTKETVEQKYTPNQQVNKPYKAMETRNVSQSRAAPWLPVQLI